MVLDQLLVTGQLSHCTGDGGASVYSIASYLMARIGHTCNPSYQQETGYLVYLGTTLGRL